MTTAASDHDSKLVKELVDESDRGQDMLADSAYIGKGGIDGDAEVRDNQAEHQRQIVSKWQETINGKNSKLRVRVEHVFVYMVEDCLHGMSSHVVGFVQNAAYNTQSNLVNNLCRYEHVMSLSMNQINN